MKELVSGDYGLPILIQQLTQNQDLLLINIQRNQLSGLIEPLAHNLINRTVFLDLAGQIFWINELPLAAAHNHKVSV